MKRHGRAMKAFNPLPSARGDVLIIIHLIGFKFQPTPLCEGRPLKGFCNQRYIWISTHSPLRGETQSFTATLFQKNFNPLPSARGDAETIEKYCHKDFNPLPSARGDSQQFFPARQTAISTHSPLRGETISRGLIEQEIKFQPTPLCEGRREFKKLSTLDEDFNPLPSARGDGDILTNYLDWCNFNPLPSARGDHIEH